MKHLKAFNETKATPSDILDVFKDRVKSFDIEGDIRINIERTSGSYKVVAIDKKTNKSVGRIYIQEIRRKGKGYDAQLRRLNVSDTHRGTGLGRKLLEIAIDTFKDIDLYGHASPNRNKGMDSNNTEEFRSRLKKFYGSVGLKSVGTGHRVERSADKILEEVRQKTKLPMRSITKTTEKDIPLFIEKISEMIDVNWEIYEFEESEVEKVIKKSLKKTPYVELYSPEEAYTKTELLAIYIFNVGISVAEDPNHNFKYENLLKNIEKILKFDKVDDKTLSYKGPDITSSSVLATTHNIKDQIKDIKETIEKYYKIYDDEGEFIEDDKLAELKIIFGCIYQFGYGLGMDRKRQNSDENREILNKLMMNKNRTPEEEVKFKEVLKKFMGGLK